MPCPPEKALHHLGVQGRTSGADTPNGIGEAGHVAHPLLEQVPDAATARQQVEGVARLEVLGEDQHTDLGESGPDLERSTQALDGVGGRHADVHHHDIGPMGLHSLQQGLGVFELGHHLEAVVG